MNLEKIVFELKKEYKDIFSKNIMGEVFVFRPLSKYEFNEFMRSNTNDDYLAEKVCDLCVLYPKEYDFRDPSYAGTPETLKNEIIGMSGFGNKDFIIDLIGKYQKANNEDSDRRIENIILSVFTQFTVDDIQNWNIYKILDYYSRAIWIIDHMRTDYINPNQEQQEQNQPQGLQSQQMRMGENILNRRG